VPSAVEDNCVAGQYCADLTVTVAARSINSVAAVLVDACEDGGGYYYWLHGGDYLFLDS